VEVRYGKVSHSLTQQTCKGYQQLSARSRPFIYSSRTFLRLKLTSPLHLMLCSSRDQRRIRKATDTICHLLWKYFIVIITRHLESKDARSLASISFSLSLFAIKSRKSFLPSHLSQDKRAERVQRLTDKENHVQENTGAARLPFRKER
jgi:3-phosphoglycerate kinase